MTFGEAIDFTAKCSINELKEIGMMLYNESSDRVQIDIDNYGTKGYRFIINTSLIDEMYEPELFDILAIIEKVKNS